MCREPISGTLMQEIRFSVPDTLFSPGAFSLRYKTASPPKGGVKVRVAPPLTSALAVLTPVAAFVHSTANRPLLFERSTVKLPPEGA